MSPASPNIVVTGIGLVTPLAASRERTWWRLLAGDSGIQPSVRGLEARIYDFSLNGARSRMGDFALIAAKEALAHAGLAGQTSSLRIACAVSQSKPVVESSSPHVVSRDHGDIALGPSGGFRIKTFRNDELEPELIMSSFFGWSPAEVLARDLGLSGPSTNVVAACATGVASIAAGEHWLRANDCDAVLVGAAESSLNDFYRAGFRQMGVLADETRGAKSARPFDRDRSGFVMGEGAAVLVLEREDKALARGAVPLARLTRTVLRQSTGDILRFDEDGSAVAALIRQVCADSKTPDYINAHGTGTFFNDDVEARGIKQALGASALKTPVSSTKAATGHLLGAAGALEAALTVLALRDGMIPPTLNLDNADSDLDLVPHRARPQRLSSALSLSYGFGGQMGAVLFERWH